MSYVHNAPDVSPRISAFSSCLPILVPSYRDLIASRKAGARFLAFENVVPRLMATLRPSRANKSRNNLIGFGVLEKSQRGYGPAPRVNMHRSHISCAFCHVQRARRPNRGLVCSLHGLPGALVSCLQIGIVEKLPVGTVEMLNVALDDPDLLGKTGHRHGHGSRNQNGSQHARDSCVLIDPTS
jgi:hypothetical protein